MNREGTLGGVVVYLVVENQKRPFSRVGITRLNGLNLGIIALVVHREGRSRPVRRCSRLVQKDRSVRKPDVFLYIPCTSQDEACECLVSVVHQHGNAQLVFPYRLLSYC